MPIKRSVGASGDELVFIIMTKFPGTSIEIEIPK